MGKKFIDQQQLKELLDYNSDTGDFSWKQTTTNRVKIGDVAGSQDSYGYISIGINGKTYLAHRLVWLYVYGKFPSQEIDHLNHNRSDNRLINLREVTRAENSKNVSIRSNNRSGVTGVCWIKSKEAWKVVISNIHIGYFNSFEEAKIARKAAEMQYGFHQNHGLSL